jgi:tRNA 2-thiouridine synthesizing protein D
MASIWSSVSRRRMRRGITDEILAPGFRISGLGQLVEAGIQCDRLVTFGD